MLNTPHYVSSSRCLRYRPSCYLCSQLPHTWLLRDPYPAGQLQPVAKAVMTTLPAVLTNVTPPAAHASGGATRRHATPAPPSSICAQRNHLSHTHTPHAVSPVRACAAPGAARPAPFALLRHPAAACCLRSGAESSTPLHSHMYACRSMRAMMMGASLFDLNETQDVCRPARRLAGQEVCGCAALARFCSGG